MLNARLTAAADALERATADLADARRAAEHAGDLSLAADLDVLCRAVWAETQALLAVTGR